MQDEVMKVFIEQLVECITGISEAFELLLQQYHVNIAEKEFENGQNTIPISMEEVKKILVEKTEEGKSEKIKELLILFQAEKLSDVNPNDYEKLCIMAKDI